MPMIQTDSQHYTDIADAIRDMQGSQTEFYPADMPAGIRSIPQEVIEEDYFAPVIYSETEREIGVWTDGKPLYQITVFPTVTGFNDTQDFSVSNVEKIVNIQGISGGTTQNFDISAFLSNGYNACPCVTIPDATKIRVQGYLTAFKVKCLTIQYTKTTDAAGSGSWTPQGVPAVHYDGNEKVIGTWFGETLYEKTVYLELTPGVNTGTTPHGITGIAKVVDYEGTLFDSMYGTDKTCKMSQTVLNSATSGGMTANSTYSANLVYVDATNVMYSLGSYYHSNAPLYLTVQYTKTSS